MTSDVNHITRNYHGDVTTRDVDDYFRVEVESYDPQNTFQTYHLTPKLSNCKKTLKDGIYCYESKNGTSSWKYQATKGVNEGLYRVEALLFPTTISKQYFNLELKTGSTLLYTKKKINTTSPYTGISRIDLGITELPTTTGMTINLSGTKNSEVIAIIFKKIRKYTGDTHNEGELTILEAKGSRNGKIADDTFSFKILHRQGTTQMGGYEEERNSTGLVFQYRDQVNAYIRDVDGVTRRVFGGYISDAILSEDNMTINLTVAGRGADGNRRSILNELVIGGALPTTTLSKKCKDLYEGLKYLARGVELPYQLGNITNITSSIPSKDGFFWDLSIKSNARKVKASNATTWVEGGKVGVRNGRAAKRKSGGSTSKIVTAPHEVYGSCRHCSYTPKKKNSFKNYCPLCKKSGVLEWNPKGTAEGEWTCTACDADYCGKCGSDKATRKRGALTKTTASNSSTVEEVGIPGQAQTILLWDSTWNKVKEKVGYHLENYPVFYIRYGLGRQGYNEDAKTYIPKEYDANGNSIPGTGKWETHKKAKGYNTSQPGKWHIELHFTRAATTRMNNTTATWKAGSNNHWSIITVEFTDTDITSRSDRGSSITTSGAVNRINPVWSYNTLRTADFSLSDWLPETQNKYLRKVVLKYYHNSEQPLYDATNETDFKLLVQNLGFRQGEAYAPEVIQTNGQKINDTLETLKDTLRLDTYWVYGADRARDSLYFRKKDKTISKYELEQSNKGNVLEVSSISYPVITNLCNSVTKIYKVPSGTYGHVSSKDAENLIRFGEHQNLEVLNDETGYNYANYLARSDSDHMQNLSYSYTLIARGYRNVEVGEYMVCTLLNTELDDIQPVESIEWEYNPEKRPMIRSTYGMGEMSDKLRAKTTLKNIRKGLNEKRTTFSGGSAEVIYDGL